MSGDIDNIIDVNEQEFESTVLQADKPVVVDFWAEWCAPCRMLTPIIEELAQQQNGKVIFAKVNVDESPQIATQYGVRGIPTLILFKDGNVLGTQVGALSKSQLQTFLDEHV